VARDVVGVRVSLEHVHDPNTLLVRSLEILLDRIRGIDNERLARRGISDQVGGAAEIVVDELAKQHVTEANTDPR
jgi:hypothetical protein